MSTTTNAAALAKALGLATDEIRREFKLLVKRKADELADDIKDGYARVPRVSGTLRREGATVRLDPTGLEAAVRAKAPHAHLIELGTVARETKDGADRGAVTRPYPVTLPAAARRLPEFVADAERLLQSELNKVKG